VDLNDCFAQVRNCRFLMVNKWYLGTISVQNSISGTKTIYKSLNLDAIEIVETVYPLMVVPSECVYVCV